MRDRMWTGLELATARRIGFHFSSPITFITKIPRITVQTMCADKYAHLSSIEARKD